MRKSDRKRTIDAVGGDPPARVGKSPLLERHPVIAFILAAYGFSWAFWIPLALSGAGRSLATTGLIVLGGFGPLVAAVALEALRGGRPGLRAWVRERFRLRCKAVWYAWALLLPPLIAAATLGIGQLFGTVGLAPERPPLYGYPILLAFVFFLGGGQEEPGWRGYALPHLQVRFGAATGSLLLGLMWAGWHLPLFFSPASSQVGLPLLWYVGHTVAITFTFTWLFNSSAGSVLPVMLLHAGLNAVASWIPLQAGGGATSALGILLALEILLVGVLLAGYGPSLSGQPLVRPRRES